jgi:hypothetical protein
MPLGLQDIQAPKITSQLAHEGGKVVSPTHWPPLLSLKEISLGLISVRGRVDPQGHCAAATIKSMKNLNDTTAN